MKKLIVKSKPSPIKTKGAGGPALVSKRKKISKGKVKATN